MSKPCIEKRKDNQSHHISQPDFYPLKFLIVGASVKLINSTIVSLLEGRSASLCVELVSPAISLLNRSVSLSIMSRLAVKEEESKLIPSEVIIYE